MAQRQEFMTKRVAKVTFDATDGSTIASHRTGLVIPKGALVTDCYYVVRTTFTDGSTDAATIALTLQSAGDIKAAIAISDATNVYDAGVHCGLLGSPAVGSNASTLDAGTALLYTAKKASSLLLLTANRELTVTVAVAALTAGIMDIFVEYVI